MCVCVSVGVSAEVVVAVVVLGLFVACYRWCCLAVAGVLLISTTAATSVTTAAVALSSLPRTEDEANTFEQTGLLVLRSWRAIAKMHIDRGEVGWYIYPKFHVWI